MKGRWNCDACGIAYNYITQPRPKVLGICDKCGGELKQRADDTNEEAIKKRLDIFHKEITPLLKNFNHVEINGEDSIDKVTEAIKGVL
jgi:adenylate kinase